MVDPGSVVTALASLGNTVFEIARSNDAAKRNALLIEFQQALIQAQGITASEQIKNASLVARNQELEAECVRLRDWSAEKAQHVLVEFSTGMFAQVHKDNVEPLKSAHKFCNTCFEDSKKSLLQMQSGEQRKRGLFCPACKTTLWLYHNAFTDEHVKP